MPGNNRNRRNNRNRKKRKQYGFYFDYTLLFVLVFIVGFGLTMIYSTSSYTAQIEDCLLYTSGLIRRGVYVS